MGKLRGIVAKVFLYALFGLLILSFAVWGIGDMFRGRTAAPVVAEVGEQEVTQEEFRRAFSSEYNRLRQMLGGDFDIQQAQALGLPQQILSNLVDQRLYQAHARELGLTVTDDQVRQEIFSVPAFQNEQGEFDRFRYEQALRMGQLTEADLVQELHDEMLRSRLLSAVLGGMEAPTALAGGLYAYRNESRTADYVVVEPDAAAALPEPSEEELQAHYENLVDQFQAPEYREVSWLHIDPAALVDGETFPEEELRTAYDERMHLYSEPERRRVEQILLEEESEAEAARERLVSGASFAAVAEDMTGTAPVDLGLVAREDMPEALAGSVFSAEEGNVTEPVESAFGWHLIRIVEVEEERVRPFEEVRDELAIELSDREAVESAIALANRLDDLLAAGAAIEEAADDLNLRLHQAEAIDSSGENRQGETVEDLPARERFIETVFSTQAGDTTLLVETEAGGYFVLRVDGIIPPAARPFEEVREDVLANWQAQEREALAFERADELAERLHQGEALSALAEAEGLALQSTPAVQRQGSAPSPELVEQLFEADVGEVIVASGPEWPLLAVLESIESADSETAEQALSELRQDTSGRLRQDMEQSFRLALEAEYGVTFNQRRIDDVLLEF